MKRPSFQFYPADWRNNAKLRRCSDAARGAWMDVLCLLHDSDEYGVCRWPLTDLARAAGVPIKLLRELSAKDVLKGSDGQHDAYVYAPRHAGQAGAAVALVAAGPGPCWYCSRMVRDEWVRMRRGGETKFTATNQPPKAPPNPQPNGQPKGPPKPPFGGPVGDGATSSSPSPSSNTTPPTPSRGPGRRGSGHESWPGFERFWEAWPASTRKAARRQCSAKWVTSDCEPIADRIVAAVEVFKTSADWLKDDGAYVPAPLVWLNQARWEGVTAAVPIRPRAEADFEHTRSLLSEQAAVAARAIPPPANLFLRQQGAD